MIYIKNDGETKTDAKVKGMQPEILLAIIITNELLSKMFKRDLTLTSVTDSHKPPSLHPKGQAFDMRTWGMSGIEKVKFGKELSFLLGDEYDIVVEGSHIHVEFDPPSEIIEESINKAFKKGEEDALREIYEDREESESDILVNNRVARIEKKLDKILEWIKFHGEDMKCKSGQCKFNELEHPCRLTDEHICVKGTIEG